MVSFRVSLDELKDLTREADRRQVSVSYLLRLALDRMLGSGIMR